MTAIERYRQVARLHIRCLDQSFLATLGAGFLTLMYEAIDQADETCLLVEEDNGQVQGFITGGTGMGPIYRRMLRQPVRLGLALAPAMLHPSKVRRVFETLRYASRDDALGALPKAELLSLAVAPEWRGKAVADRLYLRLVDDFRGRNVEAFRITVGAALAPAHRFYQRMGAILHGEIEVHGGEVSSVYVHRV